jgi:hypothetical protein
VINTEAWWHRDYFRLEDSPQSKSAYVDDVHLAQPVGFVWFRKPRYRVKAQSRKVEP